MFNSSVAMLFLNTIALLILSVTHLKAFAAENEDAKKFVDQNVLIDLTRFGERIYGEPDQVAGAKLADLKGDTLQNPDELGPYLEGDLLIPNGKQLPFRNGLIAYSARWPGAVVPYEIDGRFKEKELAVIKKAFKEYHTKTCIRFKPRSSEDDYIVITSDNTGCWSSLGRLGGRQVVNLQSTLCFRNYGTTMHELMHALGFMHEQNRSERDSYIRVLSQNVKNGAMVNFQKGSALEQYAFGIPYDYASVMHYSKTSFSKNGKPTIEALVSASDK
ncbi:zinc metalloproteinase nas-4-like [Ceratitis capitata]|uniref:zinc metalloproteinase nas-4-like n=1 Tax=Ceratitis capitata TaxID=7213 RepID=UPI00032A20A3|nr:zinc metalloproteinase nas-4-like [Ceratitis capitata]